jgi:hypothetical protein
MGNARACYELVRNPKSFPSSQPFCRREKGFKPLALREGAGVRKKVMGYKYLFL